ncbi:MAG: hypothetical protein AAFY56_16295 [Pseudomonadota bacterium]
MSEDLECGIGVIVPSSNRTVERVTETVLARFDGLAACYARIPLWGDARAGGQNPNAYDFPPILEATEQLAHAKVELLCWNGTKGASIGFDPDRELAAALTKSTGIKAVSTALATLDLFDLLNIHKVALIIPGRETLAELIAEQFGLRGIDIVAKGWLGVTDNFACAEVPPSELARMVREQVQASDAQAALIFNTNARGLTIMAPLEQELSIPVLDSTAIGVWACLRALDIDPRPAADLGQLFRTT